MTKEYDITRKLPGRYVSSALYLVALSMLLSCVAGCRKRPPRPSEMITFWRKDKNPYGAYVAYNDLKHIFPNAEIKFGSESVAGIAAQDGNKKALIYIGPRVDLDESEINTLMRFLGEGNHVFISALRFGDSLLNTLNIKIRPDYDRDKEDSMRVSVLQPGTDDALSYAYPGLIRDTYVTSLDSQYATVLGRDRKGRPNIVRFRYKGGGALILHFAPMALTNYFLLHKKNMGYYDNALSYIPEDVSEVLWNDGGYSGRDGLGGGKDKGFSALRFITGTPPLYWGLIILLLLLLMVYLFESKRRQRIVPVIEGLRNNSLDFVQTIGRLYYQRRDNQNLAGKMAIHFQDYIRSKYNLSVHLSDEAFVDRLSWKTGVSKEFLNVLKGDLLRMQQSRAVADEELLALNKKLEEFYKQA